MLSCYLRCMFLPVLRYFTNIKYFCIRFMWVFLIIDGDMWHCIEFWHLKRSISLYLTFRLRKINTEIQLSCVSWLSTSTFIQSCRIFLFLFLIGCSSSLALIFCNGGNDIMKNLFETSLRGMEMFLISVYFVMCLVFSCILFSSVFIMLKIVSVSNENYFKCHKILLFHKLNNVACECSFDY